MRKMQSHIVNGKKIPHLCIVYNIEGSQNEYSSGCKEVLEDMVTELDRLIKILEREENVGNYIDDLSDPNLDSDIFELANATTNIK